MTRTLWTFLIYTVSVSFVFGQQNISYTMSNFNIYESNVAFAGYEDNLQVYAFYRSQWQDLKGQPQNVNLNATLPLYFLSGGAGISLETFTSGAERHTQGSVSFNRFFTQDRFKASLGGSLGIKQIRLDQNVLITPEGEYSGGLINHNDPILGTGNASTILPIYSIAGFISIGSFDAGIALHNIVSPQGNLELVNYNQSRYIDILGIYYLPLRNGYLLESGLNIRTNLKQVVSEVFGTVKYGNVFGGVKLRGYSPNTFESFSLIGGIKFDNRYTIAYSYDVLVSRLGRISDGSHEIMLKYSIAKEINTGLPPKTMYNPRNL